MNLSENEYCSQRYQSNLFKAFFSLLVFVFLFASTPLMAMDKKEVEQKIDEIKSGELENVEKFLLQNQEKLKRDPEYYVILLNYSWKKGQDIEKISISPINSITRKSSSYYPLLDLKSKKPLALMEVETDKSQRDKIFLEGINRTQAALPNFPDRLDIHFGIISMAQRTKNWNLLESQLIEVLKISKQIDNQWKWGFIGYFKGEPKDFMLDNVQSNLNELFSVESPSTDESIIQVSKLLVEMYPESVYGYTNLGVIYSLKAEYDLAQSNLNKAKLIAPNDPVVLNALERLNELKRDASKKILKNRKP